MMNFLSTKPSIFLFLFSVLVFSCKKENQGPLIFINPSSLVLAVDAGKILQFNISASSDNPLVKMIITSKSDNSFTQTILDSSLTPVKNYSYTYEYLVQSATSDYTTTLIFKVIDQDGNSNLASRTINVKVNNTPLAEKSGFIMYSKNSLKADAYDLTNNTPQFSSIGSAGSRDLQNSSDDDATSVLSGLWISPAGGKFVSFNGFDYVNATKSSLIEAYNSGTKLDKIGPLQQDNIVLTKLGRSDSASYVAIKILFVIDSIGSTNDRYIFNLKK